MPIQGYSEWSSDYAECFGFNREAELKMLLSWESIFDAAGFTLDELRASKNVIGANPPRFRADHLAAINDAVRADRARRRAASVDDAMREAMSACANCEGTGRVTVPHPECLDRGDWVEHRIAGYHATCAVACSCQRGARIVALATEAEADTKGRRSRPPPVPMSLAAYERRNPRWREQVEAKRRHDAEMFRARAVASDLDRVLGRLIRKFQDRSA